METSVKKLVEPARVHRDVYACPEIFDLEIQKIWNKAWIYVGHKSQVPGPGDYYSTTIGLTPVVMVRDNDGDAIHVIHNRCGHRGAKICNRIHGKAAGGVFRCPYHGWTFKCDGSLRSLPSPGGYRDVGFDKTDPAYGMQPVARVENYRGFVFASLADDGPDLVTFLDETRDTIDNMLARSPSGEVEVTGLSCHQFRHANNWKFFVENLHDGMHPMIAHAGTTDAVKKFLQETDPERRDEVPEAEVIAPFGGGYEYIDKMGFSGLSHGHGYMGGKSSIFSGYEQYPDYVEKMEQAHGKERTREILSKNTFNTLIYPSCTVRDGIQSIRVVKPVSFNETIIESWTFRLVGAPEAMLRRTLRYSRLINSPGSLVGPDDMNAYVRIQESAESKSIEWIDMHRFLGMESEEANRTTSRGTSDYPMRHKFQAWLDYMTAEEG